MSKHAAIRSQQRGIPPLIAQWLSDYGDEQFDGRGGVVRFFSRRGVRALERNVGRTAVARMSEFLNCYKVESAFDGSTITVGHRFKRLSRR